MSRADDEEERGIGEKRKENGEGRKEGRKRRGGRLATRTRKGNYNCGRETALFLVPLALSPSFLPPRTRGQPMGAPRAKERDGEWHSQERNNGFPCRLNQPGDRLTIMTNRSLWDYWDRATTRGGRGGLLSSFLTRNLGLGRRVVFPSFVKDFEGVKSSRVAHRQRKLEYLRVERIQIVDPLLVSGILLLF